MDLVERLQKVVELKSPSFVVFHEPSVAAEAICGSIRAGIGKQITVARLRSDSINAGEGAFIQEALFKDQMLVLIGGENDELPDLLLKAWERFRQSPHHAHTHAGHFIKFSPDDAKFAAKDREEALGLVLVVPKNYKRRIDPILRDSIDSLDQLGPAAPPLDDIRDLG